MDMLQDRQVAAEIEKTISRQGLRPGDKLPAEDELAVELGLTRHQTRKGLAVLKERGRLVQKRGAGTFIPMPQPAGSQERTFAVIGPFTPTMLAELSPFQQGAFEYEHHVQIIDTGPLKQDPAYERACLQRLLEKPVAGVMIEPTPFLPSSFDLYESLRLAGTKVAVLNCPVQMLREHAVFQLNFHKAGYMACVHLAMAGWRSQCLVSALTLETQWQHVEFREGALEAAKDYGIDLEVTYGHVVANEATCRMEWTPESVPPALAEGRGYICSWTSSANLLRQQLLATGCVDFGLISGSRSPATSAFPYILLDPVERYKRVLEYFLDGNVAPTSHLLDTVQPVIIEAREDV